MHPESLMLLSHILYIYEFENNINCILSFLPFYYFLITISLIPVTITLIPFVLCTKYDCAIIQFLFLAIIAILEDHAVLRQLQDLKCNTLVSWMHCSTMPRLFKQPTRAWYTTKPRTRQIFHRQTHLQPAFFPTTIKC